MRTKEEQLLFEDLCEMLSYKPVVYVKWSYKENKWDIKPYLRPMSSMTDEEDDEYMIARQKDIAEAFIHTTPQNAIDWLNANHFDYRGLIEKGLALEAPKDMYTTRSL